MIDASDQTMRELSRLPVRVPLMGGVSAASLPPVNKRFVRGWDRAIFLGKVLGASGVGTNGQQWAASSSPLVERYGYAKSPFTLFPAGNVAGTGSGWRNNAGYAASWQFVGEAFGSIEDIVTTQAGAEIRFELSDLPANAKSVRSVQINITAGKSAVQPLTLDVLQIVEADGVTPITEATAPTLATPGGLLARIHRPKLVGADFAARWAGAQVRLLTGSGAGTVTISNIQVVVSYRVDMSVEPAVEATGQRFVAWTYSAVKPGAWCFLQQFHWSHGSESGGYTGQGGRELIWGQTVRGFAIAAPSFTGTLSQSTSRNVAVTIFRYDGFAGTVDLSISGLPAGVTGSFSPASTTGTSSTLTLTADSSVVTQRINAIITATSGSESHQEWGQLLIRRMTGDFSIATAQPSYTLAPSAPAPVLVIVTSLDSDFSSVVVEIAPSIPVQAPGVVMPSAIPTNRTVIVGELSQATVQLNLSREGGLPLGTGTYPITIRGIGGAGTKTITFDLIVTA